MSLRWSWPNTFVFDPGIKSGTQAGNIHEIFDVITIVG